MHYLALLNAKSLQQPLQEWQMIFMHLNQAFGPSASELKNSLFRETIQKIQFQNSIQK